jgi:hypothetical protein
VSPAAWAILLLFHPLGEPGGFYPTIAYEILLGVGTGILTEHVNALPAGQQAVGVEVLESYADSGLISTLAILGGAGVGVAMIGAVVALRAAYGLGWPALVLLLVSAPLIAVHEPPFGPVGLAMFVVAVVLLWRRQASEAPGPTPETLASPARA